MLFYEFFYRKYGIRRAAQLMTPPLPLVEALELPRQSILHYVTTSPIEAGPAVDDFLFRNITRPIMMGHILAVGDTKGMPRRMSVAPETMIRSYHIKNRRFKMMRDLVSAGRDPNTLVVYNYGIIPHLYHYARSLYAEYYKWWNIQAAVWKNVGKTTEASDRQQFIVCKLPTVLPSVPDLRLAATTPVNQKTLKIFNSPDSLLILELWKWLGADRSTSVLSNVPENKLDRVNLIFQESGRWFVVNLGVLNNWRIAPKKEQEANPETVNLKGITSDQIQRRFLRLTMALFEVRTTAPSEIELAAAKGAALAEAEEEKVASEIKVTSETKPAPQSAPVPEAVVVTQKTTLPTIDPATGTVAVKHQTKPLPAEAQAETSHMELPDEPADDIKHDEELEKKLNADLAELENISKNHVGPHDDEPVIEQPIVVQETATLEDGVMKVCDRLADSGLISAAEYRRYGMLAGTYRNLVAPDGKTTLDKFIQIDPTVLKIPESPVIKEIPTVVDKTMLKSSLLAFDQRYVKEVLHRDVAGMVLNIQNAGIAVTNYEVERVEDVLGSYDAHTVRVTPVDGQSSTFRFKLPAIEDDGTYQANGVKYRMRKQRGDLPIRKIAPDRVALTSYYGKVFATRSSKRVNNYGEWLRNAVMARGLSTEDMSVSNLHPASVFDSLFPAPRLYSSLAMGFRGFTLTPVQYPRDVGSIPFELSFDHTKRELLYGKDAMMMYEKDGTIICGQNHKGQFLLIDKHDALYYTNGDSIMDYGTIEMVLGLESEKAPVEFAELKIMGRTIPIGIIIGYELGLEKLMKLLKVTPRRVPAGTRLGLGIHEYALVFSDESLVFNKDDREAAIVLAGFNEFHRVIRNYSVYEFDKPGVYLNVLETGGASVRYLREIDLLYQLFIDPITRDLLVEMGEPTDFRGLLIRSCQMLLTDQHPNELDPEFMRIKGYERMAGAVYSEITRSIRAHNGRAGKSKQPIDLNPYAVWQNISKDPSIEMVSDINPIQNLKEMEAVTYSGTGGRNSRSMTKHTRAYHPNDMGTISESTVDSSDVSINTYLSADPQFTSLRGMSRRYDLKTTGATALLSTSALLSPAADRDD